MPPRISTRRRTSTGSCASELFLACALFINLPEARMRGVLLASIAFALVGSSLAAQDRKGIRFWNLTLYTITSFLMSPAGKDSWGPDQCKNDRDGTVDHDERLRITGIEPGRYDVKLADKIGRVCIVRNVEVKDGAVFSIEEKQLTDSAGDGPPRRGTLHLRPGKGPSRPRSYCGSDVRHRFHCNRDQAASFPDALATWVAIASIKAGDRQS